MANKRNLIKTSIIPLILLLTLSTIVFAGPSEPFTINNSGIITYGALPLHVEGEYVKNALNQTVFLRGVNRPSGFTASCTGIWFENDPGGGGLWGRAYTSLTDQGIRDRMQQMKDAGFNNVRLILFSDWWLYDMNTNLNGDTTSVGCRYAMRRTAEIAQEYGIYVVWAPWGKNPSTGQTPVPVEQAFGGSIQAFADFWRQMAEEFRDFPNVIFEMWNEPGGSASQVATYWQAVQLAVNEIRAVCDNLIVVHLHACGDFWWVPEQHNAWGAQAGNIVYSNHIYRYPVGATIPTNMYDKEQIRNHLLSNWNYDEVVDVNTQKAKYPCWIGEIGANLGHSPAWEETAYFQNTLELLNEWEMGYAPWEWDQPGISWALQDATAAGAPYLPNENGQALIDAIAEAPFSP